jgi:pyruvate formate lyase activating enzyme
MQIGGLQKTTLIDYPGTVACTVFTVGCNFSCPWCHNRELVTRKLFEESGRKLISEEDFWGFLEKRRGILDGVCITGGEPTLQVDLIDFCQKINKMGLKIKLDTNGSRPEVIEKLLNVGADNHPPVVDFVAVDFKVDRDNYGIVGVDNNLPVQKSMKLIIKSGIDYEFRTTVVPRVHSEEGLRKMAEEIGDANPAGSLATLAGRWVWQNFRPQNCLDESWEKEGSYSKEEIEKIRNKINKKIRLRGW